MSGAHIALNYDVALRIAMLFKYSVEMNVPESTTAFASMRCRQHFVSRK